MADSIAVPFPVFPIADAAVSPPAGHEHAPAAESGFIPADSGPGRGRSRRGRIRLSGHHALGRSIGEVGPRATRRGVGSAHRTRHPALPHRTLARRDRTAPPRHRTRRGERNRLLLPRRRVQPHRFTERGARSVRVRSPPANRPLARAQGCRNRSRPDAPPARSRRRVPARPRSTEQSTHALAALWRPQSVIVEGPRRVGCSGRGRS